ncbi:class I SAM-dependent methyltransferase [Reinekea blandensis]|uniref:Methyltransferase domain-containing protein n=1 Tax=Reinekea blandensis MED297 TaxID=314283 RepID=A4BE70_9GAMM|nr:methyltransferase domain-containing protein [Reinekea blandensis]EAR09548.1 hypothetical protein MED297_12492 [Reinekea blandensis MED297]
MSDHLIEAHGITCLLPSHPDIKSITKAVGGASIHGTKVWDASFVLMDFLNIDGLPAKSRILDIGCGWGPLTCYLAKRQNAKVISVDADEAVEPYLQLHAAENNVPVYFWQNTVSGLSRDDLSIADIVIGGDICFWDSLRDEWKTLLKRASKVGVKTVFLADPGRSPFNELVDWADERFDCQLWEHEITEPVKSEHYILQVNF